jgi:hypothetical protein
LQGRILGGLIILLVVFGAVRLFPLLFRFVELAAVSALRFWWVTLILVFAVGLAIRLRKKSAPRPAAELHVIRRADDDDPKGPVH